MRIITPKKVNNVLDAIIETDGLPPLFFGDAGVGKTQIIRQYAFKNDFNIETIECSLLSEGDLAIPFTTTDKYGNSYVAFSPHEVISRTNRNYKEWMDYKNNLFAPLEIEDLEYASDDLLKEVSEMYNVDTSNKNRDDLIKELSMTPMKNYKKYTFEELINMKEENLREVYLMNYGKDIPENSRQNDIIMDIYNKQPKERTVLFIDELLRASVDTLSQLMNLILNKEVNGIKIVSNTILVAASNPIMEIEGLPSEVYHGGGTFDGALSSRFSKYGLNVSFSDWIENFANETDYRYNRPMIHPTVLSFISEIPDSRLLVVDNENIGDTTNRTNPRTWKDASDKLYYIEEKYKNDPKEKRIEIAMEFHSILDPITAREFSTFINEDNDPIPNVEEVFKDEDQSTLPKDAHQYLITETNGIRKSIFVTNMVNYLSKMKEQNSNWTNILSEAIELLDSDEYIYPAARIFKFNDRTNNNSYKPTPEEVEFFWNIKNHHKEIIKKYIDIKKTISELVK